MSYENIFANYNIHMPSAFQDRIKRFCGTGAQNKESIEYVPFERQVDLWFFSLIYAVNQGLPPAPSSDTYNATSAAILSTDGYRPHLMQLIAVAHYQDVEVLTDSRKVFDLCLGLANAGIAYVLDILEGLEQPPLWSVFEKTEDMLPKMA